MLTVQNPKNETPEHFELKQVAKYLLWKWGCRYISTEVDGCYGAPAFETKQTAKNLRNIIDTIGLKLEPFYNGFDAEKSKIKVYGFEAKVSLSDFKAGFCTPCEYTYIIAPAGVIPLDVLPKVVGLVEVDLPSYEIRSHINRQMDFKNVHVAKKARRNIESGFRGNSETEYQCWALDMLRYICKRQTITELFKNPSVKIMKYLKNGRLECDKDEEIIFDS